MGAPSTIPVCRAGRTIGALRRTVVPPWRGGAGTATAGLFDRDDLANVLGRIELIDGGFGVFRRLHRYKAKPARVARVGVVHDRCFLDLLGKNKQTATR